MAAKKSKKPAAKKAPKADAKPKTCEYYAPEKITLTKGAVILQPGSTKKYKTGEWRTYRPILEADKCIKCGKCWMVCPDAAIKKRADGKFEIDYDYCKGCLLCVGECPVRSIILEMDAK